MPETKGKKADIDREASKFGPDSTTDAVLDEATGELKKSGATVARTRVSGEDQTTVIPVDDNGDEIPGAAYVIKTPGAMPEPEPPELPFVPQAPPSITGSIATGDALKNLLQHLEFKGMITDDSTP